MLITIRADGRPQSSDVSYDVNGPTMRVSVTDGRAKTRNLRRDDRAVMHVSDRSSWSYAAFDGTVELTPTAAEPGDATCRELAEQYEKVAGRPHPDWDEYFEAMIAEKRLIVRFKPASVVGQIH